ncbi:MAG: NUDIX domain-containing protein [Firmicutes bacterium]|jgi:8-oxo-dGTP pyrophosphatase MutT (NUDIX family)|nr:NUDIX domain-containing protein [Bacillota bacterium]MDH7494881.1 NUDIX domain-containing protein [Bacillota bacterium]
MSELGRKHEVSAGVVVFRGDRVLVIKNRFGEWVLPKGRVEPGETPEVAALREVEEETGVRAEILGSAGTSEYTYASEGTGEPVDKVVYWFLGRETTPTGGDGLAGDVQPTPQWEEGITAACFLPWQHAADLLKYDGALVRVAASRVL